MEDVSELRGRHALLASSETTAYAVMESKHTETPPEWNPVSQQDRQTGRQAGRQAD